MIRVTDGKCRTLPAHGSVLGVDKPMHPQIATVQLAKGDLLFLCTDGVLENESAEGKQLNRRRLQKVLLEKTRAEEVKNDVLQACHGIWQGHPADDDITMILFRWLGKADQGEKGEASAA